MRALLVLPILLSAPLAAQTAPPLPGTVQSVSRTVAADDLSRHLRTLAERPEDLEAALGAGDAALLLGDANAAAGFFARAEQISERDARAKAGLARAFLALERPRDALRLFDDATDLGLQPALVAKDRGLAYDLRGDQRRAQRDYQLALNAGPDDETTRRLALSLAISGDRQAALQLLDPLLYRRDAEAWRARAFALAMTGDLPGAMTIVRQVMPAEQATALEPYLRRLPSMRASEKAQAVHLGRFPVPGQRRQQAAGRPTTRPAPTRAPADAVAAANQAAAIQAAPAPAAPTPVTTPSAAPPAPARETGAVDTSARRIWVQLASGSRAAIPAEWRRLRVRGSAALTGREPMVTPGPAGARLLVGPFETVAVARALVAELAAAGVSAFAWTSAAGTAVTPLR